MTRKTPLGDIQIVLDKAAELARGCVGASSAEGSLVADGRLRFTFGYPGPDKGVGSIVDWADAEIFGPDNDSLLWNWLCPADEASANRIGMRKLAALAKLCVHLVRSEDNSILRMANRNIDTFRLDSGAMDRLLARRLTPGITKVGSYVFDEAVEDSEPPTYGLRFSSRNKNLLFTLTPDDCTPEKAIIATCKPFNIGVTLSEGEESRTLDDPEDPVLKDSDIGKAWTFVRFLLSRSLHQGMKIERVKAKSEGRKTSSPDGDDNKDTRVRATWDFDAENTWRRFLCPYEIEHDATGSFYLLDPFTFIEHGEIECNFVQVFGPGKVRIHKPIWPMGWQGADQEDRSSPGRSINYYTYLDEKDAICGASDKLEALLDKVREVHDENKIIFFNDTCVVRILGEDTDMLIREHRRKGGGKVIVPGKLAATHTDMQSDIVAQARRMAIEKCGGNLPDSIEKDRVAFIGYPPDSSTEELGKLLSRFGLELGASLVPRIGVDELCRALSSQLVVITPFRGWAKLAADSILPVAGKVISPELPYGPSRTKSWLHAILKATGKEDMITAADEYCDLMETELLEEGEETENGGLAIIADPGEAQALADPESFYGVDLPAYLAELGFEPHLFLYTSNKETADDLNRLFRKRLPEKTRMNIEVFASRQELIAMLSERKDIRAVFSQFSFDRRMLSLGKATFSLIDLEKGLEGAIRTKARLLQLIRWRGPSAFGALLPIEGWSK